MRKLSLSRGSRVFLAVLTIFIIAVVYFNFRPRLHPRLDAGDVTRVRVFAASDRHFEWLIFDSAAIADLVDGFNAGVNAVSDHSPVGDAPLAGLLFILSNGNGITVSAPPEGAGPGQVEVARGQYQYRLDAPAMADYIHSLGQPASIPTDIQGAAERISTFLAARGLADLAAQGAVCTVNGRDNILKHDERRPTETIYTTPDLISISQEEYSPWQINPDMLANVLVVSVEWQADVTDYGRQFLAEQPEAEGHGRAVFLLVRDGDSGAWLIEDWE